MDSADFARWFRDSTPYISAHRRRTFVVMLGGDAIASPNLVNTVHDLALLHVLGVRLVLVHGIAEEASEGDRTVPDGAAMDAVVGAIGVSRSRLEALFSTGIPSSPLRASRITLASGNLVTAKPAGIIDGVDRLRLGEVRRVHAAEIGTLLDNGTIVLVPPIGYSTSGAAYVLTPETLAAEVATSLGADKFIVYDRVERVNDAGEMTPQSLRETLAQAEFDVPTDARLRALLKASEAGVSRCHLISFHTDGALLQELFTAEGVGTQVSKGDYRAIRPATSADVAGIVELIRPLEEQGLLARRPRDRLEAEIAHFSVAELDGIVVGCCALFPHGDAVELACVATHSSHRFRVAGKTLGDRVLSHGEAVAREQGFARMFVLTTRTEDWFAERGFAPAEIDELPVSRQTLYNYQRNSKVMIKELAGNGR